MVSAVGYGILSLRGEVRFKNNASHNEIVEPGLNDDDVLEVVIIPFGLQRN
jgi:hypothetical protein